MSLKKKISLLTRFFFCWLLPRVLPLLLVGWIVLSVLEISIADPSQIGRNYSPFNFICLWMK